MYPDREQLKKVLAATNNSINNTFILNTNAEFIAFPAADCPSEYPYVCSLMESDANDYYVGERAARDEALLDEYMKMATEAWEEYQVGKRQAYHLYGKADDGWTMIIK